MNLRSVFGLRIPGRLRPASPQPAHLLLASIFLALLIPKVLRNQLPDFVGFDGYFYLDVAQHIRDGNGLVTDVSLYHKGFSRFPHPTSIYPLWPLLLGYLARLLPIHALSVWLPTVLYFAALFLAYLWTVRLFPQPLLPRVLPGFNAGHILVVVFGLHHGFHAYTSGPHTEGLAYFLVFLGLWRSHGLFRRPGLLSGIELGVWVGLAFLARTQMLILAVAVLLVLLWGCAAVVPRRKYAAMLVSFAGIMGILISPYYLYVHSFVHDAGFASLLRFDQARGSDVLSPLGGMVKTSGFFDFISDRARGLPVAFATRGMYSYAAAYHTFQYALVAALPFWLHDITRNRSMERVISMWRWARDPKHLPALVALALCVGGFLSIHAIHKSALKEWNFGLRQALTCAFMFSFALIALFRRRRFPALALGVAVLCSGIYVGYQKALRTATDSRSKIYGEALIPWIEQQKQTREKLTIAMTTPQVLAGLTDGVAYHEIFYRTKVTTDEDLKALVQKLDIDFLIVPHRRRHWQERAQTTAFRELFRQVHRIKGVPKATAAVRDTDFTIYAPNPTVRARPETSPVSSDP